MAEIINESDLVSISGGYYSGPCWRYQIQKGDCLSVLTQRFGTTVSTLCQINGISNPDLIYAGNYLYIPYNQ